MARAARARRRHRARPVVAGPVCRRSLHRPLADHVMEHTDPVPAQSAASTMRCNDARARSHPAYWAFVVHRVSGIALTLFLPVHFFVLSQALSRPSALDRFLGWTREPAVKLAETALVLALAVHLGGGVRLLFIEF